MQKHVGLNYLFTWTENPPDVGDNDLLGVALDSWNVGNETRYLNHRIDKSRNCQATSKFLILHKYSIFFEGRGLDRHSFPCQWEL